MGSRSSLTESEIQGRDYLVNKFQEFGLDNVEAESSEYQAWKPVLTQVKITKPLTKDLDAVSNIQCPSTGEKGVEGKLIFLGSGVANIFQKYKDEIKDKIVLITSEGGQSWDTKGRYTHRREKYARAVRNGAIGFIQMNHRPGLIHKIGSMKTNAIGEIPSIGVTYEEGMYLRNLLEESEVTINIKTKHDIRKGLCWYPKGEILGNTYPEKIIILCAHYDTHYYSSGALDNTTGVATVMEIAHALSTQKGKLKRTVRFILFPVEEMGLTGSALYVRNHAKEMDKINLVMNFDTVGLGRKRISIQGFPELITYFTKFCKDTGYPQNIDTALMHNSDHFCFTLMGVPAILFREERLNQDFFHLQTTKADTIDKADPFDVKEMAMFAARLLIRVSNEDKPIVKRKTEKETINTMKQQELIEFLKLTGMYQIFFPWPK
jgi:Zn-dependent M28 family amino/carboxypeptidase